MTPEELEKAEQAHQDWLRNATDRDLLVAIFNGLYSSPMQRARLEEGMRRAEQAGREQGQREMDERFGKK
jgi:flagellar biosynthesis/type III secretory pathway protein FliH